MYDGFANRDLYAVNYDDMSGDYTQIVSVLLSDNNDKSKITPQLINNGNNDNVRART